MTDVLECTDCGQRTFYEKRRCLACGAGSFERHDPGVGELLATTTSHVTADGVRNPNRLGFARFEGDTNVIAQLEGDLEPGDTVRLTDGAELRETDTGVLKGCRLSAADER